MEESPQNSSPLQPDSPHVEEGTTNDKTKNHPRRFSDEQIKSLESIFKADPKLDPRRKLQIARDLGLQPRQVTIWFQNKRARWKSKLIEHEFNLLRSDYDALSGRFEDLKREKMSLQMQLQELSDAVKNLEKADKDCESKEYPNSSSEGMDHNNEKFIDNYFDKTEEDEELVNWDEKEAAEISQTWRNFSSSGGLFDRSSGDWWES